MLFPREGPLESFRFVTDDRGRIQTDILCPVGCGRCCTMWRGIHVLEVLQKRRDGRCPNLRRYGCREKRHRRPLHCRMFVCELGVLALEKLVTKQEIDRAVKAEHQYDAFDFLGREPETTEMDPELARDEIERVGAMIEQERNRR